MKLHCVTITGLDDSNDQEEILGLSQQYPWLEWGVLFSEGRIGQPRYPSGEWISKLAQPWAFGNDPDFEPRLAAHVCGKTMRKFVADTRMNGNYETQWERPFDITTGQFNRMFGRVQINFNADTEEFGIGDMHDLLDGWYESYDGNMITQHNEANSWIWEVLQRKEGGSVRAHQILHDASGGRGKSPERWDRPIAGVLNGYAGGIRPTSVISTIMDLEQIVGDGFIWIDMEGGVRDEDDRMNMPVVQNMLKTIAMVGGDRNWF
jgi:hypothetical protein